MPWSKRNLRVTSAPSRKEGDKKLDKRTQEVLKFLENRYSNSPHIISLDYDPERKKIIVALNSASTNLDILAEQIRCIDPDKILVEYKYII